MQVDTLISLQCLLLAPVLYIQSERPHHILPLVESEIHQPPLPVAPHPALWSISSQALSGTKWPLSSVLFSSPTSTDTAALCHSCEHWAHMTAPTWTSSKSRVGLTLHPHVLQPYTRAGGDPDRAVAMGLRRHFHRAVHLKRPPWKLSMMFYPFFVLDSKDIVFSVWILTYY